MVLKKITVFNMWFGIHIIAILGIIIIGIPLWIATILFYLISIIFYLLVFQIKKVVRQYKRMESRCESFSIAGDQFGGVMIALFANKTLIKKDSPEKFGNPKETISDNLGDNKKLGKFEPLGKDIADGLNEIDPNHVEKASNKNN
jgi:hypothetical protein